MQNVKNYTSECPHQLLCDFMQNVNTNLAAVWLVAECEERPHQVGAQHWLWKHVFCRPAHWCINYDLARCPWHQQGNLQSPWPWPAHCCHGQGSTLCRAVLSGCQGNSRWGSTSGSSTGWEKALLSWDTSRSHTDPPIISQPFSDVAPCCLVRLWGKGETVWVLTVHPLCISSKLIGTQILACS